MEEVKHQEKGLEVGPDLWVRNVEIRELREQDLNAQVMQPAMFNRLAANIRERGALESLPYCYQPGGEGPIEIVSGHHRVRAARQAGLAIIPVIVDERPMSVSQKVSKQIAHNALSGEPDEALLAQLVTLMTDADDLLASGLDPEHLPVVDLDATKMDVPAAAFDWRTVTFTFLPKQMADLQEVIDSIGSCDLAAVADVELFQPFAAACYRYGRIKEVKSVGTTISLITSVATQAIEAYRRKETDDVVAYSVERLAEDEETDVWTDTVKVVGDRIPLAAAAVVGSAVERMLDRGEITRPWQALEMWAADYLAQP